jgi:LEA14-like dessication related protein
MIFFFKSILFSPARIVTILFLAFLFAGCHPFQSFEYRGVTDWKMRLKSLNESKLSANIQVFNPNKYQVTIKRIDAEIMVNGNQWSKYQLDSIFVVPAQSLFSFPIDLKVKNSSVLAGIAHLSSAGELPYEMKGKIKGTFRSITAEVPFVYSNKFSGDDIRF